jgi:hypothetical protein
MKPEGLRILDCLRRVASEREQRATDPGLSRRVQAIKTFQHARFAHSYADLLVDKRYARSARFFLDELYGPRDFAQRDEQFERVIPGLVMLFPVEVVRTVETLAQLHAISEILDTAMARQLAQAEVDDDAYGLAWRAVGQPEQRERQVALTLAVGRALDRYTHRLLLRRALHLMRGPAAAAGLGALQRFLEIGFDTFAEMRGADEFLNLIATRERALAESLFAGQALAIGLRVSIPSPS